MTIIITLLEEAKKTGDVISIITIEGPASYKNFGRVIEMDDDYVLIEKSDGKRLAIKIKTIAKVEN